MDDDDDNRLSIAAGVDDAGTRPATIPEDGELSTSDSFEARLVHKKSLENVLASLGGSKTESIDFTANEIQELPHAKKLPRRQRPVSFRVAHQVTKVAKAMHIFKDRKKKRVDETHKHFATAHCIRHGIKHTATANDDCASEGSAKITEESFSFATRTTLPLLLPGKAKERNDQQEEAPDYGIKLGKSGSAGTSESNRGSKTGSSSGSFFSKAEPTEEFEFKEYAPSVFLQLRNNWGISQADYMNSLVTEEMYLDYQSNSKSGQIFFFSDDKNFMIKTLTHQESKWFSGCLRSYYRHFTDHPDSLLVKFVGMYRVKAPRRTRRRRIHFVIMRSTFDTALPVHKKFDLKGSRVGREASAQDRKKLFPVLKDLDLERSGLTFRLGPERKSSFLRRLETDVGFLADLGMMDYSLLVGIFDLRRVDPEHGIDESTIRQILERDGCLHSTDELDDHGRIYFMGIIDFLQRYNARKRFETLAKSAAGNNRKEISSAKPKFYAERLLALLTKFVE